MYDSVWFLLIRYHSTWTMIFHEILQHFMMTSSNGNIFHVTGPLCGEFTGHRWIPLTKASDAEFWCFLWSAPEQTVERTIEIQVIWDAITLIVTSLSLFLRAQLTGCFCPWTFRLNIGLNTSPSDSFVSYLNSHLGYSAGEFQALQLIVLAVFGAVD